MPLPRQSIADRPSPDLWVSTEEASRLLGISDRALRLRCGQWSARGLARLERRDGKRSRWMIHASVDPRLSPCPTRDVRDDRRKDALYATAPKHHVDLAFRKAHWVSVWRDRCSSCVAPASRRCLYRTDLDHARAVAQEARAAEGDSFKVSPRTLQAWWQSMNARGDDGQIQGVAALVPKYSLSPCQGETQRGRSPEAVEYFYALYRAEVKYSVRFCHDATLRESRRKDWSWPPSSSATRRWLSENDERSLSFICRRGSRAYSHRFMSHLEMDYDAIVPGELYVTDHTQCDFWCRYKDDLIRPWLTSVQDCRSRMIVGWHIGPTPHQEAILLALRMAFVDRAIPSVLRIDNGRDFKAKAITGWTKAELRRLREEFGREWRNVVNREKNRVACDDTARWGGIANQLGIRLIYAIPYAAWSKGTIERWFGTFEDQCAKLFETYCGNSPQNRPESLPALLAGRSSARRRTAPRAVQIVDPRIPSLEEVRSRLADDLLLYHHAPHTGDGMNKRSPLAVWRECAAGLRKAEAEAVAFLVSIRGEYRVGKNGVSVAIGGKTLTYGRTCAKLQRYKGQDVLVAVDPDRPAECFAFDRRTKAMIGRLEPNQKIHPCATTDDVREAIAQEQRDRKVMRQAQESAPRRTRTAVQLANADRESRLRELRATGTDDRRAEITVVPVKTGFEGVSKPVCSAPETRSRCASEGSPLLAKEGAGGGCHRAIFSIPDRVEEPQPKARARLSDLVSLSATDADVDGKDAGSTLSLIAGIRHERSTE